MYNNHYAELYHFGIKGQKHGVRRWQNEDGSLTPAGYEHYGYTKRDIKSLRKSYNEHAFDADKFRANKIKSANTALEYTKQAKKYNQKITDLEGAKEKNKARKLYKYQKKVDKNLRRAQEYVSKSNEYSQKAEHAQAIADATYRALAKNKKLDFKMSEYSGHTFDGHGNGRGGQTVYSYTYNHMSKIRMPKNESKRKYTSSDRALKARKLQATTYDYYQF